MAILHIALFRWNESVTPERIAALEERLSTLADDLGMLERYDFGADLGLRPDTFDFGVVAKLSSVDILGDYLEHPVHQQVLHEHIVPILADRAAIQIPARN